MEPVIEALTSSISPARSAIAAMISSARLPIVAFSTPPIAGLVSLGNRLGGGAQNSRQRHDRQRAQAEDDDRWRIQETERLRRSVRIREARRETSKQVAQRDVDRSLAVVRRYSAERPGDVKHERAALEAEAEGRARVSAAIVSDVAGAEVHLVLVHDIGPEAHRFSAERARVDEASPPRGARCPSRSGR